MPVHRLAAPGPKAIASLSFTANAIARLAALRPDVVHAHSLFSPATIAALARERFGVGAVVKVLRGGRGGDVERLRAKLASGAARPRAAALDRRVRRDQRRDRRRARRSRHRAWASPSHSQWRRHRALPTRGARRSRRAASTSRTPRRSDGDLLRAARAREAGRAAARGLEAPIAAPTGEVARDRRRRPRGRIAAAHAPRPASTSRALARTCLPYLQCADAFVLPSEAEGLSNAMLEAMAVGLPIVATRVGAAPELISDPDMGRLVRPGDPIALSDALEAVLFDPARADLGQRARERVVSAFDLASVADRLAGLYEQVRASRAAAPWLPAPNAPEACSREAGVVSGSRENRMWDQHLPMTLAHHERRAVSSRRGTAIRRRRKPFLPARGSLV